MGLRCFCLCEKRRLSRGEWGSQVQLSPRKKDKKNGGSVDDTSREGWGGQGGFSSELVRAGTSLFAFFSPSPPTELALAGEKSKHLVPRKRSRTHLGAGHETLQIVLLIQLKVWQTRYISSQKSVGLCSRLYSSAHLDT